MRLYGYTYVCGGGGGGGGGTAVIAQINSAHEFDIRISKNINIVTFLNTYAFVKNT